MLADLVGETAAAASQIRRLVTSSVAGLPRLHRRPVAMALLMTWLVGIGGDAATTYLMMRSQMFEEANPYAAALMGIFGVGGYVAIASAVCLAMAVISTGSSRGLYARVVVGALLLVCAGKVWVAWSNLTLWAQVA